MWIAIVEGDLFLAEDRLLVDQLNAVLRRCLADCGGGVRCGYW